MVQATQCLGQRLADMGQGLEARHHQQDGCRITCTERSIGINRHAVACLHRPAVEAQHLPAIERATEAVGNPQWLKRRNEAHG